MKSIRRDSGGLAADPAKTASIAPGKADLILHEGIVLGHPGSDSVAIAGGRIAAHGKFSGLKALVGPRTFMLKLAGRTVAPGFIDSHLHFLEAAAAATGISVQRCHNVADLLAELRLATGRVPPGNWLRAFGCDETLLFERRGPTRAELDEALPKNPLRLRHQTLHASWLNSRAITLLGLESADFKPPSSAAIIQRDGNGRLTGLVAGMEAWLTSRLPPVTHAEAESRARVMSRELAAAGVTAFTDATARNSSAEVGLFAKLAQAGAICQRLKVMIGERHIGSADEADALAQAAGIELAGVKFIPGQGRDQNEISHHTGLAMERGLDCAFHATEVEELEQALTAAEAARANASGSRGNPRFRIEHGGVIPPDDIARLAALQAWVVTNPGFIHFRGPKYASEPGLLAHLYRARSLKTAGINLAGATDAPVTPARPLAAIAAAISRASFDGELLGREEALPVADAVGLFTVEAARLARLEAGAIEPGLLADLIVLPRDPYQLNAAELMNMIVDITIVGGRVVYEHGRPALANSDTAELRNV
ncbi:MAG TPA: amidohydrolase family protein [Candidatus Binataceae bacterium]|nr:amidohydrolase family protein [Candidatus Binataceae bacterium]